MLRCRSSAKDVAPGSNGATERPCGQQLRGRPSAIDNSSNDVNLAQSTGCINGNEYLKRQLAKRGVAFEALDNGVKSCANPKLMQRLCDELSADKIDRLLRKWLRRLPHPFPARDRAAGYRYQLSKDLSP